MSSYQNYYMVLDDNVSDAMTGHRHASVTTTWQGLFSIRAWVTAGVNFSGQLSLQLEYEDGRGKHIVDVDQCAVINSGNVLLTNQLSLSVHGRVTMAKLGIVVRSEQQPTLTLLESLVKPASIKVDTYLQRAAV